MTESIAGWLISHNEGTEAKSFQLKEGRNLIGRKTSTNCPDIPIDCDLFISRHHALLMVRKNKQEQYEYLLADNSDVLGKPSLNGTYLNGIAERISEKPVLLKDGDTIQVGLTKLVLKTVAAVINVEDAVNLVKTMNYEETVDVVQSQAVLRKIIKK